jgi:tRNA (guanine-N7-)-methyltransferase
MRKSAEFLSRGPAAEITPSNYFAPLNLRSIYGRIAPLEADLGCGDGSFLVAAAAENPGRDYLGIERLFGRVQTACRKISRLALANARVLRVESSYAVRHLLPAESVDVFHLMFPDPWPKRRHWRRRVVDEEFLAAIQVALAPDGLLRIATDQRDYFEEIERLVTHLPGWIAVEEELTVASTTFEDRFTKAGVEIHRLVLRKVSDVT